jgi:hypothetical protein
MQTILEAHWLVELIVAGAAALAAWAQPRASAAPVAGRHFLPRRSSRRVGEARHF